MSDKHGTQELPVIADMLAIGGYSRHVLLCAGPDCCDPDVGKAAWVALKDELKRRDLSLSVGPNACFRTKAACLRVCTRGPIVVVYPEGTWYADMTADRIPRLVQEHLMDGRPILEWVFATNPLPKS